MRSTLLITIFCVLQAFSAAGQTADQTVGAEASKETETKPEEHFLYGWTDSKGVVHITDSIGNIPKQYRSSARKIESTPGQNAPALERQDYGAPSQGVNDAAQKMYWQRRVREARQRLADAESRYRELENRRNELLESWGGVSSGHFEGRVEAEQVQKEMDQVQKTIDAARDDLDNIIPEEARKAGVPPGWLRE